MNYYRLFVRSGCGYCERTIQHLQKIKETFVAIQTTDDKIQKIKNHYDWSTVPIIIKVNGAEEVFVGGHSDLMEENKQ